MTGIETDSDDGNFLLFYYEHYYPAGGMEDLIGRYHTREQAQRKADAVVADRSYHSIMSDFRIVDIREIKTEPKDAL